MRYNHDALPEIVETFERDGRFFGVVQVKLNGLWMAFEFGVLEPGYRALRRVLQERPYENADAGRYRYLFVPKVSHPTGSPFQFAVRIEQGRNGREFWFDGNRELISSLMWFFQLEDPSDAQHLKMLATGEDV